MRLYLLFMLWICCLILNAQDVQPPDQFLPHQIGDQFTPHHMLVDYYNHVAEKSDCVKLIEYGRTHEQRPLLLAFVSSPENLAKLESIKNSNLARAGLKSGEALDDVAIVWLSFSVHGNEAAGSESSMPVLHQLASSDKAKNWLENTLVVLDPCINPDGYSRYTEWNRRVASRRLNLDVQSIEHDEPWPGGRTNHYYFDLNRDWAWQTQIESRQRVMQYLEWLPHIHADFHEMGYTSPYFFAPAAQPYHEYLTDWQRSFQQTIGQNHAKYFDQHGWLYYTREVFDLLYPSYGDTYPMYHGSIGMTYEQGGGGRASRAILLPTGDSLTLHDRVSHHVTTALSTVEMGSTHASSLLENFTAFFDESKNRTPGKFRSYIFSADQPLKVKSFSELLDRNKIQYSWIIEAKSFNGINLTNGQEERFMANPGDLVVNVNQPFGLFTQILLEPVPTLVDSLTYDITAWSVGLGYGLKSYGLTNAVNHGIAGESSGPRQQHIEPDAYAYLIPWGDRYASYVVSQLLDQDISLRFAGESFKINGESYPRGTIIILRGENRRHQNELAETINQFKQLVTVKSVRSSWMEDGPDFGSNKMRRIKKPKVASLIGEGTSSYSAGQVWYYFEQRLDYPITLLDQDNLSNFDLDQYSVLVLPEGRYRFSSNVEEKLDHWVKAGGKLIALGSAIRSLNGWDGYELKEVKKDKKKDDEKNEPYEQRRRNAISGSIPGALILTKLDDSHPLALGLPSEYFSLKTNATLYEQLENGWNVGTVQQPSFTYGFIGHEVKARLNDSLVFGIKSRGRGSVIYCADNPLFRAFWEAGNQLMDNALFLAGN